VIFEGNCWKFGHNIPTDELNPEFPQKVQKGDIIVAGRNFGCSSGRAIAPKAIKATGAGAVLAESFSRTFYRNGHEVGLPILEVPGIHEFVQTGDRLRVDIANGIVSNLTSGKSMKGSPAPEFLLEMLRAGGLIPFLKTGHLLNR
jgi:3-isopropylmalate/(R)-2-methylmalate dehydratase small subunit